MFLDHKSYFGEWSILGNHGAEGVTFAGATENSLAEMEMPSEEMAQLKLGRGVPRTTAPKKASSA